MDPKQLRDLMEAYQQVHAQDIEELYKGKHGQTDKQYADSRSSGGKMVSGDSKQSGAEYTHGRRVKAANPGMQPDVGGKTKPKSQGKMDRGTRADLEYRKANLKKEELELDQIIESLVERGYTEQEAYALVAQFTLDEAQQLDEISLKTKMSAFKKRATHDFESDGDSDNYTKSGENKTDKIKANIVKKHGKKAGEHAERAAHAGIFGRKSFSMPKKPTNEEFELWVNALVEEGYDLSGYTWDEMYEFYLDEDAGIISGLAGLALGAKGASYAAKNTKRMRDYPKNFVKGIVDPRTYAPKKKKEQKEEFVGESQEARNNPEKYEREQSKKSAPVRGERTPMPPRGDKRREDFEKWYRTQMGR